MSFNQQHGSGACAIDFAHNPTADPKTTAAAGSLFLGPSKQDLRKISKLLQGGQFRKVIETANSLLKRHPRNPTVLMMLARAHMRLGAYEQALKPLETLLSDAPDTVAAIVDLGDVLKAMRQWENALTCYVRALQLDPRHFGACHNLATLFHETGQNEKALQFFQLAIEIDGSKGVAHFNLANVLRLLGAYAEAYEHVQKALKLGFRFAEVHYLSGALQRHLGHHDAAIDSWSKTLGVDPQHPKARTDKLHQMAQLADWRWVDEFEGALKGRYDVWGAPLAHLAMEDDPAAQLRRSEALVRETLPQAAAPLPVRPRNGDEQVTIGYFSNDFHDHATLQLMGGLFGAHDKSQFRICVYSYDSAPEDAARQKVRDSVCLFRDVSHMSDRDIAELARADGVDIAVDLKGHTENTRLGIFAHRAAPIQMSWLGYPGSTGAPFIDYIIADEVLIPAQDEQHYSEQVLRLPGSYQVNDDQRAISDRVFTRHELGLPDDAMVLCCFNATYKICPQVFAIWMEVLADTDGAVLWLIEPPETARKNLQAAARAHGVDPARLIFAPRLPMAEHLARHRAADLFLDTFAVNAHTTASDALWAGLPVVTCKGQQFAARVGASLLTACDLPQLITETPAQYAQKIRELVKAPDEIARLKKHLEHHRTSCSLFQTAAFARKLEQTFMAVLGTHQAQ